MLDQQPLLQELPTSQDIGGASGARVFSLRAYGKGNSDDFPYNIPNEKISCELARLIGLPVPEILLYEHRASWLILSRDVGETEFGETRPQGTARAVAQAVANWPGIFEETVCFDLFVGNNDRDPNRGNGNFLCDRNGQLWLIDFGNSLFYRPSGGGKIEPGIPRLQQIEKSLDALFDKPYGFLGQCRKWDYVLRACDRIGSIPDYFIENTVRRLPTDLLTDGERDFVISFLIRRKSQMEVILRKNSARFPNLVIPRLP